MTRFLKSEAGAVVLWVLASIVFAAALSPWLFAVGKGFAVQYEDHSGVFGWLAGSCERAKFSRYFNRALMVSALLLLWPLFWRVRMLGRMRVVDPPRPWADIGWRVGFVHCLVGFVAAAGLLWILGIAVEASGAFTPAANDLAWSKVLRRAVVPSLGASIVEEWLFRALLIGLWLRVSGPWMACAGTALVYAFVHFLEPPHGMEMADPRAWSAGFELLGLILQNYLSPQFIAAELLTLFVVGMALGWARLRTGSLWLPIGMHAGWIFALKSFNMLHVSAGQDGMGSLLVGDSLREGLLPLATLALTWQLLAWVLRVLPRGRFDGLRW